MKTDDRLIWSDIDYNYRLCGGRVPSAARSDDRFFEDFLGEARIDDKTKRLSAGGLDAEAMSAIIVGSFNITPARLATRTR